MKIIFWRLIPLGLFILLGAFFWRGLFLEPQTLPSVQLGKALPAFQLPRLGTNQLFTPKLMRGQMVLLNVWASWCNTCFEEQAFLMELSRQGQAIYGLDYKDSRKAATRWLLDWGNPYKAIGEDRDGRVAMDLGVYGTPETFLIDPQGIIRHRHVGALDERVWKVEFLPLIHQMNAS